LMQRAWGELLSHIMAGSFEHHVKYNGSGYPPLSAPRRPSLFSRIITIADCYDALSRPRVYRNTPYLSEKILGMFLQQAGTDFDPTLVKLLVNMVGVYPLGALVLLDNGEKGIVTAIPEDPELIDHPRVCLLHLNDGRYEKGETLDLTESDPATGAFRRNILRTLDPNEYGVSIEEFYI